MGFVGHRLTVSLCGCLLSVCAFLRTLQAYLEGGKFPSMGAGYTTDGSPPIEVKLGKAGGDSVVGLATPDDEDDLLDNELAEAQKQLQLLKNRSRADKVGKVGMKGGGGGFLPAI